MGIKFLVEITPVIQSLQTSIVGYHKKFCHFKRLVAICHYYMMAELSTILCKDVTKKHGKEIEVKTLKSSEKDDFHCKLR